MEIEIDNPQEIVKDQELDVINLVKIADTPLSALADDNKLAKEASKRFAETLDKKKVENPSAMIARKALLEFAEFRIDMLKKLGFLIKDIGAKKTPPEFPNIEKNDICRVEYEKGAWYIGQVKDGLLSSSRKPLGIGYMCEETITNEFRLSVGLFMSEGCRSPSGDCFILYEDGSFFRGQAVRGKKLFGTYLDNKKKLKLTGQFINDELVGQGSAEFLEDPTKESYKGEFRFGKPEGKGIFYWKKGEYRSIDGEFKNGKVHGTAWVEKRSKVPGIQPPPQMAYFENGIEKK